MKFKPFKYMRWAKEQEERGWSYFLAPSGMAPPSLEDLGVRFEDLRLESPGGYGDPELLEILASRYSLSETQVMIAAGTSLANFLVCAVLLNPGDDAIVETPVYESLPSLVEMLGARVIPLQRRHGEEFRVDPARIREAITPKTRVILLTSLHNPSGVAMTEETLQEIGEAAAASGARVVVDEVYLEYLPDGEFPMAASLGEPFVSTSSLTKAYGLGGLRIGWAAGPADLIRECNALRDLLDVESAAPSQAIACRFFRKIDEIRAQTIEHLSGNYRIFEEWISDRDDLALVPPDGGACAFPRITSGVSSEMAARFLMEAFETAVVPGEFFGAPGFLRVGFGPPPQILEEGLRRLGKALDRLREGVR